MMSMGIFGPEYCEKPSKVSAVKATELLNAIETLKENARPFEKRYFDELIEKIANDCNISLEEE